jgi:hypothetical protein
MATRRRRRGVSGRAATGIYRVSASLDQEFRRRPVPWLIQASLREADCKARGLGE